MNNYVYILSNKTRSVLYTGVTSNIAKRLYQHANNNSKTAFTSKYNVCDLVYFERYDSIVDAISREKQIKGWNRSRKNKLIETYNPEWKTLEIPYD